MTGVAEVVGWIFEYHGRRLSDVARDQYAAKLDGLDQRQMGQVMQAWCETHAPTAQPPSIADLKSLARAIAPKPSPLPGPDRFFASQAGSSAYRAAVATLVARRQWGELTPQAWCGEVLSLADRLGVFLGAARERLEIDAAGGDWLAGKVAP